MLINYIKLEWKDIKCSIEIDYDVPYTGRGESKSRHVCYDPSKVRTFASRYSKDM